MERTRHDILRDIAGAEAFADHYDDLFDQRRYQLNKDLADKYRRELAEYDRKVR